MTFHPLACQNCICSCINTPSLFYSAVGEVKSISLSFLLSMTCNDMLFPKRTYQTPWFLTQSLAQTDDCLILLSISMSPWKILQRRHCSLFAQALLPPGRPRTRNRSSPTPSTPQVTHERCLWRFWIVLEVFWQISLRGLSFLLLYSLKRPKRPPGQFFGRISLFYLFKSKDIVI